MSIYWTCMGLGKPAKSWNLSVASWKVMESDSHCTKLLTRYFFLMNKEA